ncbi:hypothetical protein TCAL_15005 [Tigriopus californicus]|uniref:Uncharacterized protein n=1 Tax=Tigriopus californicus TaxID=6832 RepID=A0A553NYA6_TIGCA|nr:hypothetical protein TCAL_15005 [Tigriopus californicus]
MVNPLAKSFAKVDAIHGFVQIPLNPESADLTTFITEERRFRDNRMPMGISNAGNEFGIKTDPHFLEITDLLKIVDDMMKLGADMFQIAGHEFVLTTLPALATPLPNLDEFRERRHAQAAAHIHVDCPTPPSATIGSTVLVQDPKTKPWLDRSMVLEHYKRPFCHHPL